MGRKTIILREDQFNEICGTNTAYLDNDDYAEDGTVTTKAAGAVSDSNGEKEYSKPITGKEWGHELAPETLFALLFRNGGHGLWGHWGSGLRARELTEEIDGPTNDYLEWEEQVYYEALKIMKKFDFDGDESINAVEHIIDVYANSSNPDNKLLNMEPELAARYVAREAMRSIDIDYYETEVRPFFNLQESKKSARELTEENAGAKNINLDDIQEPLYDYDLFENGDANYYFSTSEPLANNSATMEEFLEMIEYSDNNIKWEFDGSQAFAVREDGSEIEIDAGGNGDFMNHIVTVTCIKKKLQESNSELEDRTWRLDLDNDGLKKTYSYTNLTTKKTELKQLLSQLVQQNAPKQQIQKVKSALAGVCRVLDGETLAIKQRKTNRKKLGFENQFQKAGGSKNSGNGKAHSKKTKDPNVGTGYITYAE